MEEHLEVLVFLFAQRKEVRQNGPDIFFAHITGKHDAGKEGGRCTKWGGAVAQAGAEREEVQDENLEEVNRSYMLETGQALEIKEDGFLRDPDIGWMEILQFGSLDHGIKYDGNHVEMHMGVQSDLLAKGGIFKVGLTTPDLVTKLRPDLAEETASENRDAADQEEFSKRRAKDTIRIGQRRDFVKGRKRLPFHEIQVNRQGYGRVRTGKSCDASNGVRFRNIGAVGKTGVFGGSTGSTGRTGFHKHLHAFLQVGAVRHDADAV